MESKELEQLKETMEAVENTNKVYDKIESKHSPVKRESYTKQKRPTFKDKSKEWRKKVPEHQSALVALMMYNSEIRRFTALSIIDQLKKEGEIKGESSYVTFFWDKLKVTDQGLSKEYRYNNNFVIKAIIDSFALFSKSAEEVIKAYVEAEMSKNKTE